MFDQVAVGILQALTVVAVVAVVVIIPLVDTMVHKN
ncbi:hypothetical protein SAMN05880501_103109 [Ureibacillus xyleni]|uniref:Uncharacterized protein n=1 Tax=Ureibacillus xyleni TaxID=614648 RepID=A0A285S612_9BACL|nr:hypothetical protein SAMN05880501_103109 [Ureibacillus xyleni]